MTAALPQPRPPREVWALDQEGTPRTVVGWRPDGTAILAMTQVFDSASDATVWLRRELEGAHQDPEWHDEQEEPT